MQPITVFTRPEHEVAYLDLCDLVRKNAGKLTTLELLAIAANMTGKLVALQDQTKVSPEMAMEVVAKNLERGNSQVLNRLKKTEGNA